MSIRNSKKVSLEHGNINIIWTKRYIVIFIDTDSKNISYYVL